MKLVIGDKGLSTWSFRPWIAMKAFGIPFEEIVIPFGGPVGDAAFKTKLSAYTPAGRVPVLVDGATRVWESLAILEYLAENFPQHSFWPAEAGARAQARAISGEMHAGFIALRRECPMVAEAAATPVLSADALADIRRIEAMWAECRARHGGPFLFGKFSAADAMYAPVVTRFHIYGIKVSRETLAYMEIVMALPAWQEWRRAALESLVQPDMKRLSA